MRKMGSVIPDGLFVRGLQIAIQQASSSAIHKTAPLIRGLQSAIQPALSSVSVLHN